MWIQRKNIFIFLLKYADYYHWNELTFISFENAKIEISDKEIFSEVYFFQMQISVGQIIKKGKAEAGVQFQIAPLLCWLWPFLRQA